MKQKNTIRGVERPAYYDYVAFKPQKVSIEEKNKILERIRKVED
jgi:hypothetical protein